jgi:hypothetical protein
MFTELNRWLLETQKRYTAPSSGAVVTFIPETSDPTQILPISKIVYEEWRRYQKDRQETEGIRFVISLKRQGIFGIDFLKRLAKIDHDLRFQEFGWIEPIHVDPSDPKVAVNFREEQIKGDPSYLDDFLSKIAALLNDDSDREKLFSDDFILQMKTTIAHSCVERFKEHFNTNFRLAVESLLPTALHGIDSPYLLAARFCCDQGKIIEAREVLSYIPPRHWQFAEAVHLLSKLYELEIDGLRQQVHTLKLELFGATEKVHSVAVGKENVPENTQTPDAKPPILTAYKVGVEKSQYRFFRAPLSSKPTLRQN